MKPFDMEIAVRNWRQELSAKGLKQPALLDELESHLREHLARQFPDGVEERQAFDAAVQQIGNPQLLQKEFMKIGVSSWFGVVSDAFLAFAGIPKRRLVSGPDDSPYQIDPGWAAYLRAILFITPAFVAWFMANVFVVPQINAIWTKQAWDIQDPSTSFDKIRRFDNAIVFLIKDNFLWIVAALILILGLLEWRVKFWPRFRRVFLGSSVFLLNVAILTSLLIQFIAAALAATWLGHYAK